MEDVVDEREEELVVAEDMEKERDFSDRNAGVFIGLVERHGGGVSFPPIMKKTQTQGDSCIRKLAN